MVFNNAFSTGVRIHDGHVLLVDKATVSVEKDNYFIEKIDTKQKEKWHHNPSQCVII